MFFVNFKAQYSDDLFLVLFSVFRYYTFLFLFINVFLFQAIVEENGIVIETVNPDFAK